MSFSLLFRNASNSCNDTDIEGISHRVLSHAASCLKEQGRALTLSARPRPSVHLNALDPGRVVIEL
jgi:hypothetical protein